MCASRVATHLSEAPATFPLALAEVLKQVETSVSKLAMWLPMAVPEDQLLSRLVAEISDRVVASAWDH